MKKLHKREIIKSRLPLKAVLKSILTVLIFISPIVTIEARELFIFESERSTEETEKVIKSILDEADPDGYDLPEETVGFHSLYESTLFSPFNYKIFVGPISQTLPGSMIRIEAPEGNGLVLSRMMEMNELMDRESVPHGTSQGDPRKVYYKNHFASQGLNLIAPWIGVFYNGYESPSLTSSQVKYRAAAFFLMDAFLVGAGGTNGFQEPFNASKHGDKIAAGLALTRMYGAYQSWADIQSNNQLLELRYTFYFD
jgi:hypothetical protein